MRRLPGQAARGLWFLTHRLLTVALALLVLSGVGTALLAWRLAQGPLDVPWLARRLEVAANEAGGPVRLSIGGAALAWEGFRNGVDRPLDVRLGEVVASDANGARIFAIPRVDISLSLGALLLGRFEPRAVDLEGASLTARRAADGAMTIDLGSLLEAPEGVPQGVPQGVSQGVPQGEAVPEGQGLGMVNALLAQLARPPVRDGERAINARAALLSQLRRVVISNATLTVVDRQLGATWRAAQVQINMLRRPQGGVDAQAGLSLGMGTEQARLELRATLEPGEISGRLDARLSPVAPAALARLAPALAPLGVLDALIGLRASLDLGPSFTVKQGEVLADIGTGTLHLGGSDIALDRASVALATSGPTISLRSLRAEVRARAGGKVSVIQATGSATRAGEGWQARVALDLDRADFAELGGLWPAGMARNARTWVTDNITAGTARGAHLELGLAADADFSLEKFSGVAITAASGGLDGDGLEIHWLRPVPPLEQIKARLTVLDPDTLEVKVENGRQRLENARGDYTSALAAPTGLLRITGLAQRDQVAWIDVDLAGPVADLIALLRHPRLKLLEHSPVELRDPGGTIAGKLGLMVPLEHFVTFDMIALHAEAGLENVHLSGAVAGRDLDQGALRLAVTNDGLRIEGSASVAKIPAQLALEMDFRPGGPAQVRERGTGSARATVAQLAAAGLDAGGFLAGPAASYQFGYTRRRDGAGELRVSADLRESDILFAPLAWRKPTGEPASAEARLRLARDRIAAIEDIQLNGAAASVRARLEQVNGRLALLRLDRVVLGRSEGRGSVMFQPDGRFLVVADGPVVDLAPRLSKPPAAPVRDEPPGRAWTLDARFDSALMAHDARLGGLVAHVESDGAAIQRLRVDGHTGDASQMKPVHLEIAADGGQRKATATAEDAGALLRGLDVLRRLEGGRLRVTGSYDDRDPERPLIGTAEIEDFRMRDAPAITRLLQAMTLYGLVELAQGPGLGFTRLIAPFRLTDAALDFRDARAFSRSLGVTVRGRIDRIQQSCDLSGTIVPAYFFNSLLGNVPLVGRLFSPESGGGLFAASYSMRGKLDDPQVLVNPLSALTPGFLRGLFGIF
jgi:hypothetical protein